MKTCPRCELGLADSDIVCCCGFVFTVDDIDLIETSSTSSSSSSSSDGEPPAKKAKESKPINYGAKSTPESRARFFPGEFEVRNGMLWCAMPGARAARA